MGILSNSNSNYLWNGYGFMEAVDSTGGPHYPFSFDLMNFNNIPGRTKFEINLWDMDNRKPSVPPGGFTLTASASSYGYEQVGVPLKVAGTPYPQLAGGYFEFSASGNYMNLYNMVLSYPSSCQSFGVMTEQRSGSSTADDNKCYISARVSALSGEHNCNITASFERTLSSTSTWTASGTFKDVTTSGQSSHLYIPWATYYSGYDYGTAQSASAKRIGGDAIKPFNNLDLGYDTSDSSNSNSSIDLRLQQGFIFDGQFDLSASFTSEDAYTHQYLVRRIGTTENWSPLGGWTINIFGNGVDDSSSSNPASATTDSGIIGPMSSDYISGSIILPLRPYVSAEGNGAGTWTASGSGLTPYHAKQGIRLNPV